MKLKKMPSLALGPIKRQKDNKMLAPQTVFFSDARLTKG